MLGFVKDGFRVSFDIKSQDYHDEMNMQDFMEWFEHRLLPQLPP
jgi:hypothetical protein